MSAQTETPKRNTARHANAQRQSTTPTAAAMATWPIEQAPPAGHLKGNWPVVPSQAENTARHADAPRQMPTGAIEGQLQLPWPLEQTPPAGHSEGSRLALPSQVGMQRDKR